MRCMEWNAITIFLGYKWSQTGWSFKTNAVFVVHWWVVGQIIECWSKMLFWSNICRCSCICRRSSFTCSYPLLAVCDNYAQEYSIKFNAKKSKWLAIVSKKRRWLSSLLDHCRFQVSGTHVDRLTSFLHLRHTINTELTDKDDILHKRCTFIGQVNNVLRYFPRLDADVRQKLFKSYCSSIFGCEL